MNPAIMATRATSFHYEFQTRIEFLPDHYSETAGMGLYYDSNNWIYAHLTYSESSNGTVLSLLQANLGKRKELVQQTIPVPDNVVDLKVIYKSGMVDIFYRLEINQEWQLLKNDINAMYLSDEGVNGEPGEIGGFTGLFNFIGSVDAHQHDSYADFDFYSVKNF